jgi:uncharacterized membrane protein
MDETNFSRSTGMTPRRLESLADGIFAFAMTLLVLSINLPDPARNLNVGAFLSGQYNNFWNFALSFLLLAIFWLTHSQQYHHIKKTDNVTLWLNIFVLMFVVLIPFSTSMMNDYTSNMVAEAFFNSNILIINSLLAFNWWYSCKKEFIDPAGGEKHIARVGRREIVSTLVPLLALIVSFVYPGWSTLTYLLIPLAMLMSAPSRKAR